MSPLTPTITGTSYGIDYYEAAYTCLGAQYPNIVGIDGLDFPKIAFDTNLNPAFNSSLGVDVNVDTLIQVNPNKALNLIKNQIGVEYYTTSWNTAIQLGKDINKQHTFYGDEQKWNVWWKELLRQGANINDFLQLGISHDLDEIISPTKATFRAWLISENVCAEAINKIMAKYDDYKESETIPIVYKIEQVKTESIGGCYSPYSSSDTAVGDYPCILHPVKYDAIRVKGRLIVPTEGILVKYGPTSIKANDIFNACQSTMFIKVIFDIDETHYIGTNDFFDAKNDPKRNWTGKIIVDNPYGIEGYAAYLTPSEYTIGLKIPQTFFQQMRLYPEKLNEEYPILWQATIVEDTKNFADTILNQYRKYFGTGCDENKMKYVDGCGIVFENVEKLGDNIESNDSIDPYNGIYLLKNKIRKAFEVNYNCYAREYSKAHIYGDLIQFVGRMYDRHGSEFWYLLKQVLRPRIVNVPQSEKEQLGGLMMPNETFDVPTTQTNEIIPATTQQYIDEIKPKLSDEYTKNENKICGTLPPNLKYK
jgi:hypothetical protein